MFVWSKLSALQWSDAWEERFSGIVGVTTVITQIAGRKTIRVEVFCDRKSDAITIQKGFGGSVREVKKQNWAAMAPEPPEPVKVRDKLVICSARTEKEIAQVAKAFPGREIIAVPAELAFGTGHHATTATVLRLLVDEAARWKKEGRKWTVCDLGCGTGILGMAASKLGAHKVWGCDFDPQAVRVSKENVMRNKVERVTFVKADVLTWEPKQKYDCVAANIFHDVLNAAFPAILRAVADDGVVFVSGILNTQAEECLEMGRKAGLVFDKVITKGKWVTARGTKK
jgi:ribosomal protein L11 methyltransferase